MDTIEPPTPTRHLRSVTADEPPTDDDNFARRQTDLFEHLVELVGDADALWALDDVPLPDVPFEWSAVEARDEAFVRDVLTRTDECCGLVLDTEYRTIIRRLLARVATGDPRPLRRSPHAGRCAAAFVWLAGQAAGGFSRRGRPYAAWIWSWFGVGNCADRARVLYRAAGFAPDDPWAGSRDPLCFGDATLLHSSYRADLVRRREHVLDLARARQTWKVDDVDGRSARVRVNAHPSRPLQATKALVLDEGRATVIVGFGDDVEDAHYLSLTIPDAHELVRMVQHALDAPVPALAPG